MKIAVFSPYGNLSEGDQVASNFIFLLAAYLQTFKADLTAIKCDGCLDRCSMDLKFDRIRPCIACMKSQKNLVAWARISNASLSDYLSAEDLKKINLHGSDHEYLKEHLPSSAYQILEEYLKTNISNSLDQIKFFKTSLILTVSLKKFILSNKPKLLITHSTNDLIMGVAKSVFVDSGINVATYQFHENENQLFLSTSKDPKTLQFNFYSSDISHFRADPSSWDIQLRDNLLQNVNFLGLQSNQLSFAI